MFCRAMQTLSAMLLSRSAAALRNRAALFSNAVLFGGKE